MPSASAIYRYVAGRPGGPALSGLLATNPSCWVSVDFPAGPSCASQQICVYCYSRRGHQAMPRALALQWARYRLYRAHPKAFAIALAGGLKRFNEYSGLGIGGPAAPLRLFGAGDMGDRRAFLPFAGELDRLGVCWWGFSRFSLPEPRLVFSADIWTSERRVERAREHGRRIAYVRQGPEDKAAPSWADIVFPEHGAARRIPFDRRDCLKVRHRLGRAPGACYRCGRCWRRGGADA